MYSTKGYLMILFTLIALLQTFCYGAEETANPLETIITEEGVCPFFYHYCQEFYETFQGKEGATPPPPRDDIKGLLTWTEQYFTKNQLGVSAEMSDAFVDDALMEALKTKSLPNMSDREKRVFVVPGDFLHSMFFMIKKCSPSNFVFLTTDHRVLCPEDFPPSVLCPEDFFLDFDLMSPLWSVLQANSQSTTVTEFMSMQELCRWRTSGLKKTLVVHSKTYPSAIKVFDYFTQNMILLKSSLSAITETFGRAPDGILSMYPFSLAKQKIAEFILKESVNLYDIDPDPQVPVSPRLPCGICFDSCLLLKGLASAFHAEFIVNLLSGSGRVSKILKGIFSARSSKANLSSEYIKR